MIDLLRSLPQGVYWYPLVAALVVSAVRTLVELAPRRPPAPRTDPDAHSALLGYATLIQRAGGDSYAEHELERLCIGMLLQASGYRGYSVDACREYMRQGAPNELVSALREHLGEAPPRLSGTGGTLPARCELVLNEIEHQTQEGRQ